MAIRKTKTILPGPNRHSQLILTNADLKSAEGNVFKFPGMEFEPSKMKMLLHIVLSSHIVEEYGNVSAYPVIGFVENGANMSITSQLFSEGDKAHVIETEDFFELPVDAGLMAEDFVVKIFNDGDDKWEDGHTKNQLIIDVEYREIPLR